MRTVVRVVGLAFIFTLWTPAAPQANEGDAISQAREAARKWLALTDGGRYGESWDAAAAFFKSALTKADWEAALKKARAPLGALKSRSVKSTTVTHTLPGAPDGEYVVIQYETRFENKASAIETVTPMREKDGTWRVSGYFIK